MKCLNVPAFVAVLLFQQLSKISGEQLVSNNVTRLGDILDFGQLFKALGHN